MADYIQKWTIVSPGTQEVYSKTFTGTSEYRLDEAIADSTTDQLIAASLDVSAIKAVEMMSDQDITVETNSSSSPTDTFVLQADVPYRWNTEMVAYDALLLTADVTALYLTNASGSTANIKMRVLSDATP